MGVSLLRAGGHHGSVVCHRTTMVALSQCVFFVEPVGRRVVPLIHRHPRRRPDPLRRCRVGVSCLARSTASGCAPTGQSLFFACQRKEPKEKAPCSPVGLGPTALRCSVFAGRAESLYAACGRCARTAARSQWLMRAPRAPQSPALLDGSQGAQEQCGRLLRNFPCTTRPPRRTPGSTRAPCTALRWIPACAGMTVLRPMRKRGVSGVRPPF
jgi:hypothetical protein